MGSVFGLAVDVGSEELSFGAFMLRVKAFLNANLKRMSEVWARFGTHFASDDDPKRPSALEWAEYQAAVLAEWRLLLDRDPEEFEVQKFLELHPAMIPGGSGDIGPAGHHGSDLSLVFTQPDLAGDHSTFRPDFMWVTRSSGMITPILIEIEKPSRRWFQANGRPTADFRNAQDQLNDWRSWFENETNKASFRNRFLFLGDKYEDRPLVPQYLLIYGREAEFQPGGLHADPARMRRKRDTQRRDDEFFRSFDSLKPRYDHSNSITVKWSAGKVIPHAFSPVYGTGAGLSGGILQLQDPASAIKRSAMMSDERKTYLTERWLHWREIAKKRRANPDGTYIISGMLE